MAYLTESTIEQVALAWLEASGWDIKHGPEIAPDQPLAERAWFFAKLRKDLAGSSRIP